MSAVLAGQPGLLVLDTSARYTRTRRESSQPVDPAGLRTLVLATPGLDRLVGGVLLDPLAFASDVRLASDPSGTAARTVPVGVHLGEENLPAGAEGAAGSLAGQLVGWARAGARFAGWTVVVGENDGEARCADHVRQVVHWARACRRAELPAVLSCVVTVRPRACLNEAEQRHRWVCAELIRALRRSDVDPRRLRLVFDIVLPGSRTSGVATPDDAARATINSLRDAELDHGAMLTVRAPRRSTDLPGYLAALQSCPSPWHWGFAADGDLVRVVSAAWRGRPDRVALAQQELRTRLGTLAAVLRATTESRPTPPPVPAFAGGPAPPPGR